MNVKGVERVEANSHRLRSVWDNVEQSESGLWDHPEQPGQKSYTFVPGDQGHLVQTRIRKPHHLDEPDVSEAANGR